MLSIAVDREESQKVLSKLVAKTWLDKEFRKRFISEPAAVLEENELTFPSGTQVRVNENAPLESIENIEAKLDGNGNSVYEIPLPPKPATLTLEQIQSVLERNNAEDPTLTF